MAIDYRCPLLLRWLKVHRRGKKLVFPIETASALATFYGEPTVLAKRKDLDHIDAHARAFIAHAPFLVLSTADAEGWPDASPRGDAPGFVTVEDPHTLLLPDRPGNNRVDSFNNIMANPKVARQNEALPRPLLHPG
jgi:predicted pyridoxine 5'-phosphate oxidase superfamily flavin-nucleotide-binding protein